MLELVLNKLGLKRLELYDGKLSRTVLRGWKRWKRLFYYPTNEASQELVKNISALERNAIAKIMK